MVDFAQARRTMVDGQVRVNDVTDAALIAAMLEIPREKFVPESRTALAYIDDDICIREAGTAGPARYLMEPMVLAKLVQALELTAESSVLDVGAGTGYSSAILSRVAGRVIALEEDVSLADTAKAALRGTGVEVVRGSLVSGHPTGQPYDAILLNGCVEQVPPALLATLKDGGRLATVVRKDSAAKATLFVRTGDNISSRRLFDAAVPPLPGFEAPKAFVF